MAGSPQPGLAQGEVALLTFAMPGSALQFRFDNSGTAHARPLVRSESSELLGTQDRQNSIFPIPL
jgi:hypothetical protein